MSSTYAYTANHGANTVTKIDLSTFTTVGSDLTVGSAPVSVTVDPSGTYAYVANISASTVTKINLSTFTTVGSDLTVGSSPYSIAIAIAIAPVISSGFFAYFG